MRLAIRAGAAVLALAALAPAFPQTPSEDDRIAALERRIAALEAELAALKAAAPPAPVEEPPPPPPAPAPPPAPVSPTYFNPAISVIGNVLAVGGDDNPIEDLPGASLRESEVSFQAVVDPYARADFFVSFGEEGAEVEEGAVTFTALPWGVLARVGRIKTAFGKVNTLHTHALPWPDAPLPILNLLGGEEGWKGDGASVARLLPLPFDVVGEVTAEVFSGDAEGLFEAPSRGHLSYNGHLRLFRDLTETTNLDLGTSYAGGPNGLGPATGTGLQGIDAAFRWKRPQQATYRSLIARGEWMRSRKELPEGTESAQGWFVSADWQFARRWWLGGRVDRSERADDASLQDEGKALLLTFRPSEFSLLRGEVRRREYAEGVTADEVLLQLQFAIGAHGAHPF